MNTEALIMTGRSHAERVLQHRDQILQRRDQIVIQIAATAPPAPTPARTPSAGMLVAEGDSWFDYPFHDILKILEDDYGYEIEKLSHAGDALEQMAYGGSDSPVDFSGQLDEFTRRIEKLIRLGAPPKAILMSGGGNDVAGKEFGMMLNHILSGPPYLNPDIVKGVVDSRIRAAYTVILTAVTVICQRRLGRALPILLHGYDYPVPDGRGFLGGWGPLPGPWLEPGFREKGYMDLQQRISVTKQLIDALNAMQQSLTTVPALAHVKHVDLRGTLSIDLTADAYKADWANELHPTNRGFQLVTAKIAAQL